MIRRREPREGLQGSGQGQTGESDGSRSERREEDGASEQRERTALVTIRLS
jgi:hypothetical protein